MHAHFTRFEQATVHGAVVVKESPSTRLSVRRTFRVFLWEPRVYPARQALLC